MANLGKNMNYEKFKEILNRHIFEDEKVELLRKIAEYPERFIGLFRPTKPAAKILQNLLQSHEIRMGDALEEIIEEILKSFGFDVLDKNIKSKSEEVLSLDQYFTDGEKYYFIEQKIRDDHDSTKKRGQISNFEAKLEILYKRYKSNLIGIMYFIDDTLDKNKNYYSSQLEGLAKFYKVSLKLFYGRELFDYFNKPKMWEYILIWLKQWKKELPEFPEIDFDSNPNASCKELKKLELRFWRKIIDNKELWEEGIIQTIFKRGETLKKMLEFFKQQKSVPYEELSKILEEKMKKYYN